MTIRQTCLLALVLGTPADRMLVASEAKTVNEFLGVQGRQRIIVGVMSEVEFERVAIGFLGSQQVSLGKVVAYASASDRLIAGPRGFTSWSYSLWRSSVQDYRKTHSGCPALREALKIGTGIVIRTASSDCRRTRTILRGTTDPLRMQVAGAEFEILEIDIKAISSKAGERRVFAGLYARTASAIKLGLAESLTSYLVGVTGVRIVGVAIRPDVWFVTESGFPTIYPFEESGPLPNPGRWEMIPSARCSTWNKNREVTCLLGTTRRVSRESGTAFQAIAIHEAQHMIFKNIGDSDLAYTLIQSGFKPSVTPTSLTWRNGEITDSIVGSADQMATTSGGYRNPGDH